MVFTFWLLQQYWQNVTHYLKSCITDFGNKETYWNKKGIYVVTVLFLMIHEIKLLFFIANSLETEHLISKINLNNI